MTTGFASRLITYIHALVMHIIGIALITDPFVPKLIDSCC